MEYKNNLIKKAYQEETEKGLIRITAEFSTDEEAIANGFSFAFDSAKTGHRYFVATDESSEEKSNFARIIRTSTKYSLKNEYEEDGAVCYFVDMTRCNGVLRCSNELSIRVKSAEDGTARIIDGWEFNCGGDWDWRPGEEDMLEQTHPGLLLELAQVLEIEKKQAIA